MKETLIQEKFTEWMLKDNRDVLMETNHKLRLLSADQFNIRQNTARSLKNVARAVENLDDMLQVIRESDVELKIDMVGAWR